MTLKDFIPASARRKVYAVFAVVGLVLASFQIGFASAEVAQPVWLTVAFSVFGLWATAVGFTARGNTNAEPETFNATVKRAAQEAKTAYPVAPPHEPTKADPKRYEGDYERNRRLNP